MVNPIKVELEPFYKIHDARYEMYWMTLSNSQYRSYIDSLSVLEQQKADLQKRTIDFVAPGEQQPEVDHAAESKIQIVEITWMNFGVMLAMKAILAINLLQIRKQV